ncbi:MAG: ATP-binding cassette domain-containing protein [Ardenticatenaceae bacterium]|nr:ATP-binding cassette domain-containing protein [Ardenticatenaceae bacterium]
MSEPILLTKDLKKSYGDVEAVRGISFSVLRGEIFSLLGPNGAGKTTTISMLSCLLTPSSGTAVIDGHTIPQDNLAIRQIIGVVPQEIALYDDLTARQNLHFWGQMYNMKGKALKQRIDEVLEQVNLSDRADDRVETYSGGMKRRINIAVGLLHKPRLLFMDEPTVGIDPQSRRRILDMVRELRDQGMTVLYTTHYMEEAEELSDRVGIIDHGRLIALGTQEELKQVVGQQETVRLSFGEGHEANGHADMFHGTDGILAASSVNGEIVLSVKEAAAVLPAIVTRTNSAGLPLRTIEIEEPNLEAVFLHLTGRALRD